MKLLWNSKGFHPTTESADYVQNWEYETAFHVFRTLNRVSESILQTMTMKPFLLQYETIFLLMKLNLQQTVTGTTDSTCDWNKYEYKMTHWTNAAQDAHLSWKLWKMPGSLMRKLRSPIQNAKCPRSWESGRHRSSLNTPSAWAPILSKKEGYKGIAGRGLRNPDLRAGLFDAVLFNLGPPRIQQDELVKGKSLGGISTRVMDSRLQR